MARKGKGVGRPHPVERRKAVVTHERGRTLRLTAQALAAHPGAQVIEGFVGVIDGRPVFEVVNDSKGDMHAIDVYQTQTEALDRWAWARRVVILVDVEDLPQPKDKGQLE